MGRRVMVVESEVRLRIVAVLQGDLSLADFDEWLLDVSDDMHRDSTESAQVLVSSTSILLYEFESGAISEETLRSDLLTQVNHILVSVQIAADRVEPRQLPHFAATSSPALRLAVQA